MTTNFYYYLLPTVISGALNLLVLIPVKTYYLGPRDFGVYAILIAISSIILPLSSTGSTWILAGNYFVISKDERGVLLFNVLFLDLVLKIFWVSLFWMLAPMMLPAIIRDFEPRYLFFFRIVMCSVLSLSFWPTISYFIILQQRAKLHAVLELSQWIIGASVTVVCLAMLKLSTISLFIGPLAAGATVLVAGLWSVRSQVKFVASKKWIVEIVRFGMPTIPPNVLDMLTNFTDRHFIQKWFSLSQLGIYAHAANYREMFMAGSRAFTRSFIPVVAETYSSRSSTSEVTRTIKLWYSLLTIAGIFISFFSYEIVDVLTHGKFNDAARLIPLWFMIVLSVVYGIPYTQFLLVEKKNHFMVYASLLSGAVFIGITVWSVYVFGSRGAVVSIVLSNLAIQVPRRVYAKKLGCRPLADSDAIISATIILTAYVMQQTLHMAFAARVVVWIAGSFLCAHYSGLGKAFVKQVGKLMSTRLSRKA